MDTCSTIQSTMSKLLTQHLPLIQFIASAKPKQAIALLKILNPEQIKVLSEISENTIKGRVDLSDSDKARLRKYRVFLTQLASKRKSLSSKKNLLVRGVRALTLLLDIVLPVVERLTSVGLSRS
jgi:hypothetical protein